jgi:hypothetical protein
MSTTNSYKLKLAREYGAAYVAYMGAKDDDVERAMKALRRCEERLAVVAASDYLPADEYRSLMYESTRVLNAPEVQSNEVVR